MTWDVETRAAVCEVNKGGSLRFITGERMPFGTVGERFLRGDVPLSLGCSRRGSSFIAMGALGEKEADQRDDEETQ